MALNPYQFVYCCHYGMPKCHVLVSAKSLSTLPDAIRHVLRNSRSCVIS